MREIRQALRGLLKSPAFTLTAILTVVLGVGANTAVYAVVHAVLLQPLPFRDPQQLVQVWETHPELHNLQVSVPDYLDWKETIKSLQLAAYSFQAMDKATLSGQGDPIPVQATNASSDLFPLLGVEPVIGHWYVAADEMQKRPVALISESLWRKKFSSDPAVVGRSIRISGNLFTITGVVSQQNAFPVWADVWMPMSLIDSTTTSTRRYHPLEVVGRLHSGASVRQAEVETEKVSAELSAAYPATNGKIGAFIVPLMSSVTGAIRPALMATWIAVGLVLLIACINLAHLMLARAINRRPEIAIRLALGASQSAAFRSFLLEALLLAFTGGLLGIVIARAVLPIIERLAQGQVPRFQAVGLNPAVLTFGIVASFLVAVLFSLPSYVQVIKADLTRTVASGAARVSARESWVSTVLMSSEVALSLAIVLAAVMLLRSFALALETDPGFRTEHIVTVDTPLVDRDWNKSDALYQTRILPALLSTPGVRQAAAVNAVPMSLAPTEHSRFATRFGIVGRQFEPGRFPTAQTRWCTPNYFDLVGIPLLRGRWLTEADRNQPRYLVNEAFARRFFPDADPVREKLLLGVVSPHPTQSEIVGIVGDVREFGLTSGPDPTMYSLGISPEMQILVQTTADDPSLPTSVAKAILRANPEQAPGPVKPLSDYVSASLARQRFVLALMGAFAALAMILCGIGVYGVFSYSVTRRMREFGIRSAIGAKKSDLLRQVARECLVVVLPGLTIGAGLSGACAGFLRSLLYRVSPADPISFGVAAAALLFLCIGSVLLPASRAAKVDPATVLREQ
ncbi:MAG TPA: ABC transporter permease [Bryobacteraceae bacterium]|nr:ABC transporter permease [Bryobacteraceae bacterium]